MTAVHITVTRDRALIAVDTATYKTDDGAPCDVLYWTSGDPVEVNKLAALPNLRCVLTGRGNAAVRDYAVERIAHARNFDHAAEILAGMLPAMLGPRAPRGTYKGQPMLHEVYLIGWSPARQRMCIAQYESQSDYRLQLTPAPDNGVVGTYGPTPPPLPAWAFDDHQSDARRDELAELIHARHQATPTSLDTAIAYARAAIEHARTEDAAAPYGGRLVACELLRDQITMIDGGDVGLPPRRPGARDIVDGRPISTAHIMPGACTATWTNETGADSVTIPGTGGTSFKTCALRSYSNTTSSVVTLQWEAEVKDLAFTSIAALAVPDDYVVGQWVLKINGTPVLTDNFIDTSTASAPPGPTTKRSALSVWQYDVSAGDTAEVSIVAGGGTDLNAATIGWARTRLRTTAIIR